MTFGNTGCRPAPDRLGPLIFAPPALAGPINAPRAMRGRFSGYVRPAVEGRIPSAHWADGLIRGSNHVGRGVGQRGPSNSARGRSVSPAMRNVLTTGLAIVAGLAIAVGLYFLGRLLAINLIGIVSVIYVLTMIGGVVWRRRNGHKATGGPTEASPQEAR